MPHKEALSATPDILNDSTLENFQLNPVTSFQRDVRKIDTKYGQYDKNSEDKRNTIVEFFKDFDSDVDELIVTSVVTTQDIDPDANSQKINTNTCSSYVRAEDLLVTSSSSDHAHTTQEKGRSTIYERHQGKLCKISLFEVTQWKMNEAN